jgi:hypothetical protein
MSWYSCGWLSVRFVVVRVVDTLAGRFLLQV